MQTTVNQALDYATPARPRHSEARIGLACGLGAYLSWGVVPMYFKLLTHVPAMHVLSQRILWSAIFLAIVTVSRRGWPEIRSALRRRDVLLAQSASTLLIAVNWFTFIYSIESNQLLQASLGYFINPLVSVLLGIIFLGERLRPWQLVGLVLASIGVGILTLRLGQVPWISLTLAISFGFYGLLRKTMRIGAIAGLTVETWILFLPSLVVILYWWWSNPARVIEYGLKTHVLLALAGLVTAVPLLLFAAGARRLQLSTMGFLQYFAPSAQFLLAVYVYNEPFTRVHLVTFGLIWTALLIYSTDSYLQYRRHRSLRAQKADEGAEPPA